MSRGSRADRMLVFDWTVIALAVGASAMVFLAMLGFATRRLQDRHRRAELAYHRTRRARRGPAAAPAASRSTSSTRAAPAA